MCCNIIRKSWREKRKGLKLGDWLDDLHYFDMNHCHGRNWTSKGEQILRIHRETLFAQFSHFLPFATTCRWWCIQPLGSSPPLNIPAWRYLSVGVVIAICPFLQLCMDQGVLTALKCVPNISWRAHNARCCYSARITIWMSFNVWIQSKQNTYSLIRKLMPIGLFRQQGNGQMPAETKLCRSQTFANPATIRNINLG